MEVERTPLPDLLIIRPQIYEDHRGFFMEVYRKDKFEQLGLPGEFVQDNHSGSVKGVIRGLHFQWDPPMGKLMRVIVGEAFLVAVDIRKGSPTLGKWYGCVASAENKIQVWAPAGFARGFCVLSDFAEVQYKCTGIYNPEGEGNIRWNDPDIGIEWPVQNPIVSARDAGAPSFKEWLTRPESNHFRYTSQ